MATWLGTLTRGGLLIGSTEESGIMVAIDVVGEDRLSDLREWIAGQKAEVRERERRAALECCIYMAHADRDVAPEETALLEQIIDRSDLELEEEETLRDMLLHPPDLDGIAERLTHPVLREILLALAWELAAVDGRIDDAEQDFFGDLAGRLGVDSARAGEIRDAVGARTSAV